jgi:hypothetical protein
VLLEDRVSGTAGAGRSNGEWRSPGPDRTSDPPPRQRGLLSAIAIVAIAIIAGIITLTN